MTSTKRKQQLAKWVLLTMGSFLGVLHFTPTPEIEASQGLGGPTYIGTFEGSTTFTTSSSNGINPGLYLEVMDRYGNYTEYTSEDGVITLPDTEEGAYITQAKLLGKTMYRDQDTGELLDTWEEGRNLQLESVKMPVLTTTGKNLFDKSKIKKGYAISSSNPTTESAYAVRDYMDYIEVESGATYKLSNCTTTAIFGYKNKGDYYGYVSLNGINAIPHDVKYIRFNIDNSFDYSNAQLEKNTVATSYEPYKTNILTVNEEVELRAIGEVKDELNLLTGELTQRIGEIVLDGSEKWEIREFNTTNTECVIFTINIDDKLNSWYFNCDKFKYNNIDVISANNIEGIYTGGKPNSFFINVSKTKANTVEDFKSWLSNNNVTVQYQSIESVKTVDLTNTYEFPPVTHRELVVKGTILPLVCSVTTPTEPLSFVLNPNGEQGQQFIAPDFSISNQTPANVSVELRQFTQLSNVLNDVLPDAHDDWNRLNQKQSKDFALALEPKPSEGWQSLIEGPRYVADSSNFKIGTIKPESRVSFTFSAYHGRAFTSMLNPEYRLVMVFDFSS